MFNVIKNWFEVLTTPAKQPTEEDDSTLLGTLVLLRAYICDGRQTSGNILTKGDRVRIIEQMDLFESHVRALTPRHPLITACYIGDCMDVKLEILNYLSDDSKFIDSSDRIFLETVHDRLCLASFS